MDVSMYGCMDVRMDLPFQHNPFKPQRIVVAYDTKMY